MICAARASLEQIIRFFWDWAEAGTLRRNCWRATAPRAFATGHVRRCVGTRGMGVVWQVTPVALAKAITDPESAAAMRAFDLVMQMTKIDVASIEAACRRHFSPTRASKRQPGVATGDGRAAPAAASGEFC